MNLTYIVLLILLLIYVPIYFFVIRSDKAKAKGIVKYGPCIMIKTKWGIELMTRLGKYKRFWGVCGFLSKIISLGLMIYIVAILVIDLALLPSVISRGGGGMGIEYALAIPGINPMLPLVYGWIGLIIAMVVHEISHGIQTKANDMDVDSTGVLYAVVPLGAFVEPNEEQVQKCSRKARMNLYAAGITTNFVMAMVLFIVMTASLTGGLVSTYGDSPAISGVTANSPGLEYNIPSTSVITSVNGEEIATMEEFSSIVNHYGVYDITYDTKDAKDLSRTVTLGTYINNVVDNSPAKAVGMTSNTYLVSIETKDGTITEFGLANSFSDYMKTLHPGEEIIVTTTGSDETYEVILGDKNGVGYLGISTTTSGFVFTTPNTVMSTAVNPFHGCTTVSDYAMGAITYVGSAIKGYSPIPESTQWWFDSTVLPDNVFWVVMSLIYWTFWLNLVLGISNALPAVPFDGGFLFLGGLDFIFEKLGVMDQEKRDRYVNKIGSATTFLMLFVMVLVIAVIVI